MPLRLVLITMHDSSLSSLHCRTARRLCLAVLLALWLYTAVAPVPCVAHAWPQFLGLGRSAASTTTANTDEERQLDRSAAQPPPLPFPGAAERAAQARALWQEMEAKGRLSPCWKRSLLLLQAKCEAVRQDDALRSRLALFMAACDADSDGREHPSFHCGPAASAPATLTSAGIRACIRGLADTAYAAFLQYRLHADVLCAYLQEELYQERTEAAVAAMAHQVEGTTHTLSALQQSGAVMLSLVQDTQARQRAAQKSTAALQQQLGVLQEGHTAALAGLQAAANNILDTSTRTDAVLDGLQRHVHGAAAEALAAVEALHQQSVQHYATLSEQTRGVAQLLAQVDHIHRLLSQRDFTWHRVLTAVGCVVAAWMATAAPRTAAARLPATALTLIATVGLPLLQWWTRQSTWLLLRRQTWQGVCAVSAVAVVGWTAAAHTPPEVLQRRVMREEVTRVWRELQQSTAPSASAASVLQPYVAAAAAASTPPSSWCSFSPFLPRHVDAAPPPSAAHRAAGRTPSPVPVTPPPLPPLSIIHSPQSSDADDGDEGSRFETSPVQCSNAQNSDGESGQAVVAAAQPRWTPSPPSPPHRPPAAAEVKEAPRKRGRPPATGANTSAVDAAADGSPPQAKMQRAEAVATPRRGKRGPKTTPKKRG